MTASAELRLLANVARGGLIGASEATRAGFHSQQLTRLVRAGVLARTARGQYQFAGRSFGEHHGLVTAARVVPHGVICLLSALQVHGIGTQLPADAWVALPRGARTPAGSGLPLRVVHMSAEAFATGVEHRRIAGQSVRVYSVAKTLADLFKFRSVVGLDVALEALREAWRDRKFRMSDLDQAAEACRVARVMRPYVEAVVA